MRDGAPHHQNGKIACERLAMPASRFERGVHYDLLELEGKSLWHPGTPIWRSSTNVINFEASTSSAIVQAKVPGVQGAFTLKNVLSAHECEQIRELSLAMGYQPEPSKSSGRPLRSNCNLLWCADDSLWQPIFQRVLPYLPSIDGGGPLGLNQRCRLYRYEDGDTFGMHHDGWWPGSSLHPATGAFVETRTRGPASGAAK